MSFSTFQVVKLSEDSSNDFRLDYQTAETEFRILVTEDELRGMGDAITDAADGKMPTVDDVMENE